MLRIKRDRLGVVGDGSVSRRYTYTPEGIARQATTGNPLMCSTRIFKAICCLAFVLIASPEHSVAQSACVVTIICGGLQATGSGNDHFEAEARRAGKIQGEAKKRALPVRGKDTIFVACKTLSQRGRC
jgi:hypothetical protein